MVAESTIESAEWRRLAEDERRESNWKRWGPYLADRQWGTVREDYSADGESWPYFPHDHARRRAYRWGEDGLLGICDRQCRLAFALALWNGRDPILKERLYGLSGPEGNHGEDVKECYHHVDATPTASYLKALYKYPQAAFPYARLLEENRRRGLFDPEFELADTGVFDERRYFDVVVEYAKAAPEDILIRVTVANRGPAPAPIWVLPTLWFRNTWAWGRGGEGFPERPQLAGAGPFEVSAHHAGLGGYRLRAAPGPDGRAPEWLFTENETNARALWGTDNDSPFVKDAFHEHVVGGKAGVVNPDRVGTKAAALYRCEVAAGGSVTLRLRLSATDASPARAFDPTFDATFAARIAEADAFYAQVIPASLPADQKQVARQAYAGLVWSKQFYYYVVDEWLEGDPAQPPPPLDRARNRDWGHLYNRDVISMPDKWEYPWYAAWDLAFHVVPFAHVDPDFAKQQLLLFLREWYMHPNGQIPAYEWALGDVNPPVHAWAAWRVYKLTGARGRRDRLFLERVFQKLLLNFTWWVNRKDPNGRHLFSGGFLGLDNIGIFDRSKPLPTGGHLEQADGTAWMAFYCGTMLSIALELADQDPAYEDVASKFFEHYVAIADAMNNLGGTGLWDEREGFYFDQLHVDGQPIPLRLKSMVGIIPLFACEVLERGVIDRLPGFKHRFDWFLQNRPGRMREICQFGRSEDGNQGKLLLAIPSRARLERLLRILLDEKEFLSPFGVRSLSRAYRDEPFRWRHGDHTYEVWYAPGESHTRLFGGNSNWRGPVWMPVNYLLIEALERYFYFYGDSLKVECPVGAGRFLNLGQVAHEIGRRVVSIFLPDANGRRPCHGRERRYADDADFRDLVSFHEYFHGEDGSGLGASHQTGWTALVARLLEKGARGT